MEETVTTKCSELGQPEFKIRFDNSVLRADVNWLTSILENSVLSGSRFKHGQTIELGSVFFQVCLDEGFLLVTEPDFSSVPIVWKPGVVNSLNLLRIQKDIAESFDLSERIEFAPLCGSLIVGKDVDLPSEAFVLERTDPDGHDSGWFVGCLDTAIDYSLSENLHRLSVYEAIVNWRRIAGFLALPSGWRVEISTDHCEVFCSGEPFSPKKGSLFADFFVHRYW